MDLFDVMFNCRAIRRLKPDPVPEPMLLRLVGLRLSARLAVQSTPSRRQTPN